MVITSGVLPTAHHEHIPLGFFGLVCDNISFSLLCYRAADKSFLGLYIIGDLACLVFVFVIFEYRFAFPFVVQTIPYSACVYLTTINIHAYKIACQLHRLVFEITITM